MGVVSGSSVSGPFVSGLRCRACSQPHSVDAAQMCERCWGPLDVVYDLDAAAAALRRRLRGGSAPRSMWRYAPLLPVADPGEAGAGIGWTPLRRAEALAAELDIEELWLKDESANPTGSFKDRVVAVALARARELGAEVAACASTGNLAASVTALAPRFGMRPVVLVPADPPVRAVAGAVAVEGSYDALNRLSGELAAEHPDWAWVNVGLRAWYVEGAKTVAYEIAEQLHWLAADHVLTPMASGALALEIHRGFGELAAAALVERVPHLSAAQPAGCAPVAFAFAEGLDEIRPVRPSTVATSLAMGDPPDGTALLEAVRSSGGSIEAVPEDDIVASAELLAHTEGVETEPAGGVVVGALRRLAQRRLIARADRVVVVLTAGAGRREAQVREPTTVIPPTVEAFESWWQSVAS